MNNIPTTRNTQSDRLARRQKIRDELDATKNNTDRWISGFTGTRSQRQQEARVEHREQQAAARYERMKYLGQRRLSQCDAIKANGDRCRNRPQHGHTKCGPHLDT